MSISYDKTTTHSIVNDLYETEEEDLRDGWQEETGRLRYFTPAAEGIFNPTTHTGRLSLWGLRLRLSWHICCDSLQCFHNGTHMFFDRLTRSKFFPIGTTDDNGNSGRTFYQHAVTPPIGAVEPESTHGHPVTTPYSVNANKAFWLYRKESW